MYRAIGVFALVQITGFAFEALWHGALRPGADPPTVRAMAVHLATVHLPLYAGVAGFFVAIAATLAREARRRTATPALRVALGGSALQVVGESWHAWTHLRLAPDAAVPGMLSLVGFVVALAALAIDWRRRRRVLSPADGHRRRAA